MERGDIFKHLRVVMFTALFCTLTISAFAQPGLSEFADATREVKRSYQSLTYAIHGLGAIWGFVGAVRVFVNWQSGKQHVDGQVQGWLFACVFFQLIAVFIGGIYGV
jgi:hypothetical protein